MTNPVRTSNFNCVKNMHTCFPSGTFAFGSARLRLRITCTNNAVSNVAKRKYFCKKKGYFSY